VVTTSYSNDVICWWGVIASDAVARRSTAKRLFSPTRQSSAEGTQIDVHKKGGPQAAFFVGKGILTS
jgi:hypothetical protein